MRRLLPAYVCCAALLASGVASGLFTNRWASPADFGPIQDRMDAVPRALGPWAGRSVLVEQDALDLAGIKAHISRDYRDSRTGRSVRVLLVAGRPGPIAVHTPDVCFRGAGYELTDDPRVLSAGPAGNQFWGAVFAKKQAAVPSRILVLWAWNAGTGWQAAEPYAVRVRYSLDPVLLKLYLVTEATPGKAGTDLLGDFPDRFLDELTHILPPTQTQQ
jgi:hypothetical protein